MRCAQVAARILAITLVVATAVFQAEVASGNAEAKPTLDGTWSVMSMEDRGETLPKSNTQGVRFVFSGDQMKMRVVDKVIAETEFTTDTTEQPPTIRMTYGTKPTLGIFQLDGDDLKICLSGSINKLPSKFVSEAGSTNRMLIVLKRGDHGPTGWPLFVMGVDGTGLRPLAEFPKDMAIGSPDCSVDGRRVAFDAWRLARNETYGAARVYTVNIDGTELKDIAVGAMPSWSPDGKRITFCQYSPNRGVWVMNADGSNKQILDADGWGSDWSPAGNEIAYTADVDGANICIVDPDTGERRLLLKNQEYQSIYWNLSWSADGKHVCFKGVRANAAEEIATVSTEGDEKDFRVLLSSEDENPFKNIRPIVAWDGNSKKILVSVRGPDDKYPQLYALDPKGVNPPKRLLGQDAKRMNGDMAWSPDGKTLVFSSQERK
ncbi:MAG: TIGR03067 domain-containing protein [Planctomycetes bacterium]|nr:TIGR03067 domain-containing protein [Planctomycetota bacterium]MBL7040937.1 TIGR03067 domain-containing protein [Pirellulaceae bacterium]